MPFFTFMEQSHTRTTAGISSISTRSQCYTKDFTVYFFSILDCFLKNSLEVSYTVLPT